MLRPTRTRALPMKKLLIVCILLLPIAGTLKAQDIIVTKEGKDIQAKVLEITETEIKYLDFENQEGPTYVLNKTNVLLIRYENGKNEVFSVDSTPTGEPYKPQPYVSEGMRYRDYKKLYNYRNYTKQFGDPYNPTLSGVASWFIPGLGQGICDEWGRGAAIFGGYILGSMAWAVSIVGTSHVGPNGSNSLDPDPTTILLSTTLLAAYNVWNIVDAVHVAKIKNMYYQDIRGRQTSLQMNISPSFTYIHTPETSAPVMGLSMHIGF